MPETNDPRPAWLRETVDAVRRCCDRHEALRWFDTLVLIRILSLIEADDLPVPAIVAVDARIAAVWHQGDRSLRVEVEAGEVRMIRSSAGRPVIPPANAARLGLPEQLRGHVRRVFGPTVNDTNEHQMLALALKEGRRA